MSNIAKLFLQSMCLAGITFFLVPSSLNWLKFNVDGHSPTILGLYLIFNLAGGLKVAPLGPNLYTSLAPFSKSELVGSTTSIVIWSVLVSVSLLSSKVTNSSEDLSVVAPCSSILAVVIKSARIKALQIG